MYEDLINRLRAQADAERFFSGEKMLYDEAADAIEELSKLHETQKKNLSVLTDAYMKSWIPVAERLPDSNTEYVLCCGSKGGMFVGWAAIKTYDGSGKCTGFQNSGKGRSFTHWMPLPQKPKDGEI